MLYECRPLNPNIFTDDPNKIGYIQVLHKGKSYWARPCLPFGEFYVPTKEWMEKYVFVNDAVANFSIYCQHINNSNNFVWVGFGAKRGKLPNQASTNYPKRRVKFTESWLEIYDDTPNTNFWELSHIDGSKIKIDRTSGSEKITVIDGVTNFLIEFSQDGILIGKQGITANLGNSLKDLIDAIKLLTVTTTFGPSGTPINAASFTAVQTKLDSILDQTT